MNVAASRYGHPRVPCSMFQFNDAPCVGVIVLVYEIARTRTWRTHAHTNAHNQHEHVRNMKTLLPALPMSALASRWIARQSVYSNVANDVDWLANTSWYDCFFFLVFSSHFTLFTMCNSNAFDYCCCCHSVEWTRRRPLYGSKRFSIPLFSFSFHCRRCT